MPPPRRNSGSAPDTTTLGIQAKVIFEACVLGEPTWPCNLCADTFYLLLKSSCKNHTLSLINELVGSSMNHQVCTLVFGPPIQASSPDGSLNHSEADPGYSSPSPKGGANLLFFQQQCMKLKKLW